MLYLSYKKILYKYLTLIKLFFTILLSFVQVSCTSSTKTEKIIIASAGKIESLDPAQANTLRSLQLISNLGDPLYRFNSEGVLEPRLARSMPKISDNGLTIDIPLKENILFHDGTEFNAEAMAFSLNRFIKIGTQSYVIGDRIKEIETPNKFLLRLRLNRPSSSINGLLTSINLTPVSPKSYVNHQDKFLNKNFIGTGPYKVISFQPEKQSLAPFIKYWDKKPPNNKGIEYINFTNSSSLFGAIRNGEVDVLLSNSIEDTQRISLSRISRKGYLLESEGPAIEMGYLTLNTNSSPFNDKQIRKAISYSINRELISEKVSYGLREPLRSIVPPILKRKKYSPWPTYNPKTVKDLMSQSGYCSGKALTIPLTFRSNVPADKLFALTWKEQIKQDLPDCLKIEANGVESTTVYKQLSDGAYSAVILDWTGAYPDPEAYLYPLLGCEEIVDNICKKGESVLSGSFWAIPKLQKALDESEKLLGKERLEKLIQVEEYASQGSAYIPIWLVKQMAWAQKSINQPEFDGSGFLLLDRLKKDLSE